MRDHVGVLDLPGFSRFNIAGAGAADWLSGKIAGALPKVGRMNLAYFPDARGRILTEMSVLRHDEDFFTLITAAAAQWHDMELLRGDMPDALRFEDQTRAYDTFVVTGPKSRDLLAGLTEDADLSLPWLSLQGAKVAGADVMLARVSFAGELGWEVHVLNERAAPVYDAILAAGAKPFGMWALKQPAHRKGLPRLEGRFVHGLQLVGGRP